MNVEMDSAISSIQTAIASVSGLIVSYSFSAIGAVILLILGYFLAGLIERSIKGALARIRGIDDTLQQFFSKIARYIVLALFFVMVLGQFGVQTASIIAAIGAIGLAIGLALQGTLQNIAAGIMLLALRPFRVGEYVEVGDVAGTVEEIGLFASRLRAVDGIFILAPNSTLWNQPVRNFNRNGVRRNDLTIGIGYNDDIDLAQATLADLANGDERVMRAPAPQVFVDALADSSVAVTLRYWTSDKNFLTTRVELTKRAKIAFDERGISIPFPQQEVVYRNAPPVDPALSDPQEVEPAQKQA